ncbi:hypothetical protein M4A92_15080 [Caldibacillus thermoamylovorans]|uniref:hypothetical protein n=1 Tax=Caldibacillus thermoamylovorans TaxID=35841 RepID=UPI00203C1E9E|nr:hypothetical protein [Caldibacillus thermoamylovorans]MCM3799917.1 hypothetical protein [Caldibacillus thermoamylovorans]
METFLFLFLGFAYLCLFIWELLQVKKYGIRNHANFLILVIFGLVYDNLIIPFGRFIGEGNTLEALSKIRYWFHALFTPTLILFAWNVFHKTGLLSTRQTLWKLLAYVLTIGFIIYELLTSIIGKKLEPKWEDGVLTYENVTQPGSPLMVMVVTLVLGAVGVLLMKKLRFPWLFIGTVVMLLGGLLANWIKNFPIMNVFELLFIVSLVMTKHFQFRVH